MKKIRIGILFGGQSAEHEVSIKSAKNVFDALDRERYEPVLIGISKKGEWLILPEQEFLNLKTSLLPSSSAKHNVIPNSFRNPIEILNHPPAGGQDGKGIDVIFPALHGPFGEDGTVQGMLKLLGIPFVGSGVLGSAIGMDKDITKRLLRDANIPIVPFLVFYAHKKEEISFQAIKKDLGHPFFVKPANLGSSVGVNKVHLEEEFKDAIDEAFKYDRKILIEKGINAREIECAVLGNDDMKASVPGEIIPHHEFYDYDAKYIDEDGAGLQIPAELAEKQTKAIQQLAIKTCKVLGIEGMARVDFFLDKDTKDIYVNEVNTIPGFTNISMFPKLWQASGVSYAQLIDQLIVLALERYKTETHLRTDR